MTTINIQKLIHQGYKEFEMMRFKGFNMKPLVGKYYYIYSSAMGSISLIEINVDIRSDKLSWEIYCLQGSLFNDVERFDTKKEATHKLKAGIAKTSMSIRRVLEH